MSGLPLERQFALSIRPAVEADRDDIWRILGPVIRTGETYALDPALSKEDGLAYWLGHDRQTFVAESDGKIVGTYYLRANQSGGGSHVANCGFVTDTGSTGRGIARAMCQDALRRAKDRGFEAMQFNFVIGTNTRAIALWQSLGFEIVSTLPRAFRHPRQGLVDAHVMFRAL